MGVLDAQTGTLSSGKMKAVQQRNRSKGVGGYHGDFPDTASATGTYGDSGGASRFFYCGKATKKDRGPGNDHPTVKPLAPDELPAETAIHSNRRRDPRPLRWQWNDPRSREETGRPVPGC